MRVHDNIENYDLLPGVSLNEAEEERVYELLSKVVPDLTSRCASKMRTRLYFNKNIKGRQSPAKEITTHDDVFVAALYSVLIDARFYFGYVLNLLRKEILERALPIDLFEPISDIAVHTAQAFDMEEIRKKARSISNLYQRMVYVEDRVADFCALNEDDYEGDEFDELMRPIKEQLSRLHKATQQMLKYAEDHLADYEDPIDKLLFGDIKPVAARKTADTLEKPDNLESVPNPESEIPKAKPSKSKTKLEQKKCALEFSGKTTPKIRRKLLRFFHEHIGKKPGVKELEYLAAASDLGMILIPDFPSMCQEFPEYADKDNTFSYYLGSSGKLLKDNRSQKHKMAVTACANELKEALK